MQLGTAVATGTRLGTRVSDDLAGSATGLLDTAAQLGTALGVAALITISSIARPVKQRSPGLPALQPPPSWPDAGRPGRRGEVSRACAASCSVMLSGRRMLPTRAASHGDRGHRTATHPTEDARHRRLQGALWPSGSWHSLKPADRTSRFASRPVTSRPDCQTSALTVETAPTSITWALMKSMPRARAAATRWWPSRT